MTAIQMISPGSADTKAIALPGSGAQPVAHTQPVDPAKTVQAGVPLIGSGDVKNAVDTLNKFVQPAQQSVEFSIDKDSGHTIVKVMDTATNKVLIQFPNQTALAIAQTPDKLQGLLIDQQI